MFSLILAMDNNRGIGKSGGLPWRLKQDMAFFKAMTTSSNLLKTEEEFGIVREHPPASQKQSPSTKLNSVIMGRKTWDSIPEKFRPLIHRTNIVLSRSDKKSEKEPLLCSSLAEALTSAGNNSAEIFVIGGHNVYTQCLAHPECKRIYLTHIYQLYTCDTFFDKLPERFQLIASSNEESEGEVPFRFMVYESVSN